MNLPATTDHTLATTTPPAEQAPMLMPAHVAAVVPFTHHETYSRLSLDQQKRVSLLLQIFAEMATAPEGLVACSNRIACMQPGRGFSGPNLRALYYSFRAAEKVEKGSGWLKLAKLYKGPRQLPPEFIQEVRRRIEANAVSARAALTQLRTEWDEGASIPGYGTWREYFRVMRPCDDVPERFPLNFYPRGWSVSNLYTKQSSKAERAWKRRGYAAAKRYLPHVMRDLSQLRFMELIVIDDFETDQIVLAWNPDTKRWQLCRCAGLLAIDAATRTKLAIGLKPRWTDDEGTKQSITRADVQTLLYEVFRLNGKPVDYGCTILCENGGAAISNDFELALELLLGVQVARTGLISEKTLRNGFVQSGGKPWEKPWIESMFHLMHGVAGDLPGQKGATYQLKPADLEAKILYTEKLLNTDGLPPEVAEQMRVPFLKVDQFLAAYDRIFARMEERTDHRCQGFEERFLFRLANGNTVPESATALLSPDDMLAATPLAGLESPRERRERLAAQSRRERVAESLLACLLLTPKKVKLINHRLTFVHQGKGFTFADADAAAMQLTEGTELLGYFDPARPAQLHVTDLKGRYLGAVQNRQRVDIRDTAAIGREQAEVSRLIHACVSGPVQERHEAENAQLGADREHNQALLREHNLAPLPSATDTAPKIPTAGDMVPATEKAKRTGQSPTGLSHKLSQPKARDAFAAQHAADLPRAIAADVGQQQAGKTRAEALQAADDLDAGNLL